MGSGASLVIYLSKKSTRISATGKYFYHSILYIVIADDLMGFLLGFFSGCIGDEVGWKNIWLLIYLKVHVRCFPGNRLRWDWQHQVLPTSPAGYRGAWSWWSRSISHSIRHDSGHYWQDLVQLMAAYCAFDINYPKQYQHHLLRLLQTELLHDSKDVFFQSVSYVNFVKRMSASCWPYTWLSRLCYSQ